MNQRQTLIDLLARRPLLRTTDLAGAGIGKDAVRAAVEEGVAIRPARGFLAAPSAEDEQYLADAVVALATGGILARLTAAQRHRLGNIDASDIEVLVPYAARAYPRYPGVRLIRTRRADALTEGVETREVLGVPVPITTPARTVVDLFRFPDCIDHAVAALTTVLDRGVSGDELLALAARFGVRDQVEPRIEAHNSARSNPRMS